MDFSLNPCCNGILPDAHTEVSFGGHYVLILVVMEYSLTFLISIWEEACGVLILVVMEYSLTL